MGDESRHSYPRHNALSPVQSMHWFVKVLAIGFVIVGVFAALKWFNDRSNRHSSKESWIRPDKELKMHNCVTDKMQKARKLRIVKLIAICVCGTRFDVTHFGHYAAFDCTCPGCFRIVHISNRQ